MMRRRASPSARTIRTAPTAPCVPVDRDGAPVPRSDPPDAGPVTGNGSCTSVEGGSERSTGPPDGPRGGPADSRDLPQNARISADAVRPLPAPPACPARRRRGSGTRIVTERPLARWLPAIVVGLVAFIAARLAMLPGFAFWDTGELQAVAPLMGTGPPQGSRRTSLLGWFVSVMLQPFGEPRVPDEPVRRRLPGGRRRGGGRPRPGADRIHRHRHRGRHRADVHRLVDRHARRDARPPPGPARDPVPRARRVGGRRARTGRSWRRRSSLGSRSATIR